MSATVTVLERPDAEFVAVLDQTRFGGTGLRFRRTNFAAVLARWAAAGGRFLAARDGGRTVGTFCVVPHDYVIDGFAFRGWYRAGLSVIPEARKTGVGGLLGSEARRVFLDEAAGPALMYGFVEAENEASQRVQLHANYAPIGRVEALPVGRLRPAAIPGVEPLDPADHAFVIERLRAHWAGHVLGDDYEASLADAECTVLRDGGKLRAGCQSRVMSLDIDALPGVRGAVVGATSPLLARLSPMFALRPNRQLSIGNLWWDDEDALVRLVIGTLALARVAHGTVLFDTRSPHAPVVKRALHGVVNRLIATPMLDAWAGWKGLPDGVVRALQDRPLGFSPTDPA